MDLKFLLLINLVDTLATNIPRPSNHRFDRIDDGKLQLENKELESKKVEHNETIDKEHVKLNSDNPWDLIGGTDRIQFQIEGHEGPQTYIFGFDTGYGKNRQYRLEERHQDGTVKGQYGYYDAKGQLRKVRYVAKPYKGYTEIHHERNI